LTAAAAVLCGGCASPARPQTAAGATPLGAPRSPVRADLIDRIDPPDGGSSTIRLPEQITLPATYRLVLVEGHLMLVRAREGQTIPAGPTSLRIVAGEIARGELAYQPALLPQELAAEVAAGRESAARLEGALAGVMQRSWELAAQTERLEAQTRGLAALLPHPAGGASGPSPAPAPRPSPGPGDGGAAPAPIPGAEK
jgi:hypothetical protein